MSDHSRSTIQTLFLFSLCSLLAVDVALRIFDGNPAEATRIEGRERDAAIDKLSGTYYQMAAANTALASSINRLTAQLATFRLEDWAEAEEQLAESQAMLAEAAGVLAMSIAPPDEATDSGELPGSEVTTEGRETGEDGPAIQIEVEGQ